MPNIYLKQNLAVEINSNKMMSNVIQSTFKFLEYDPEDIKLLHKHITDGGHSLDMPVKEGKFSPTASEMAINNVVGLIEERRTSRRQMRYGKKKRLVELAADKSAEYGMLSMNQIFPSMSCNVIVKHGKHRGANIGAETNLAKNHVRICLPVTWYNRIWERNLSAVHASDGLRFVIDVKEKNLSRLNQKNIIVFRAKYLKVYKGKADEESGWIMMYETDSKPVVALYNDFAKCESLIQRRIKDRTLDVLNAI